MTNIYELTDDGKRFQATDAVLIVTVVSVVYFLQKQFPDILKTTRFLGILLLVYLLTKILGPDLIGYASLKYE